MSVRENSANSLSLAEVLERLAALETRVAGIIRNRRGEEPIQRACYSIREFCTAHGITSRERNYSKFIAEHADQYARQGLLQAPPPAADNVIPLVGR